MIDSIRWQPQLRPTSAVAAPSAPAAPVPATPAVVEPGESFVRSAVPFQAPLQIEIAPLPNAPAPVTAPKSPAISSPSLLTMIDEPPVAGKSGVLSGMMGREATYLGNHSEKGGAGLVERYVSPEVSPEHVEASVAKFATTRGVDLKALPTELLGRPFDGQAADLIKDRLQGLSEQFFANKEGSHNPLKQGLAQWQGERFIDLVGDCQKEGSLGAVSAIEVYRLASQNMALLAQQDQAAAEIIFGEHGVRHLVGHNIKTCEHLADELQGQGVKVSAKDRLLMHQAMLVHDIGYATDNVRDSFAQNGIKDQESGHPVLAGRYVRERLANDGDPINSMFSNEDMDKIHRLVMYHDMDAQGRPGIDFAMTASPSDAERTRNLESMTRVADNSHAFDDKLADVIYRHPSSLKAMRMIKAAGESGDGDTEQAIRDRLSSEIQARPDLGADDKRAMTVAVGFMQAGEYDFSARRILGSKPGLSIDGEGKLTVSVQESPIHDALAEISGQPRHKVLGGYIEALTGSRPQIDGNSKRIDSEEVAVQLQLGSARAQELSPFQQQICEQVLEDKSFREWALADVDHMKSQNAVTRLLKDFDQLTPEQAQAASAAFLDTVPAQPAQIRAALQERLEEIRNGRAEAVRQQLANG